MSFHIFGPFHENKAAADSYLDGEPQQQPRIRLISLMTMPEWGSIFVMGRFRNTAAHTTEDARSDLRSCQR